ncbi:hypothetical protein SDJN02_09517, partial [Cucurbita argyrosperma subsp. argyrosperma]
MVANIDNGRPTDDNCLQRWFVSTFDCNCGWCNNEDSKGPPSSDSHFLKQNNTTRGVHPIGRIAPVTSTKRATYKPKQDDSSQNLPPFLAGAPEILPLPTTPFREFLPFPTHISSFFVLPDFPNLVVSRPG